jgi:hypothetical protein
MNVSWLIKEMKIELDEDSENTRHNHVSISTTEVALIVLLIGIASGIWLYTNCGEKKYM